MRAEEIRELSDDEVRSRVAELEEERFRLRFRAATETLEDPLRLRLIRKEAMVAVFTHNDDGRQMQSVASSTDNGRTWAKYAGNPVLPAPPGMDLVGFRDPGVWREDGSILRLTDRVQRHYTTAIATVKTEGKNPEHAVFSPDGKIIAAAGGDGVVSLWRLE